MSKTVSECTRNIAYNLLALYQELVELSEEIEYREGIEHEICAGDELKFALSELMDEIQKLHEVDY
jgi:hypothetical protein